MAVGTTAAILGGAAVVGGMGYLSTKSASKKAQAEAAAARGDASALNHLALQERRAAAARLESVGVPPIEAMRITLESPELVGLEVFRDLAPSAFQDIEVDPLYKEAQERSLSKLEEIGEKGRTEQEKFEDIMSQRKVAGEESARQKLIRQKFAERGLGGSGVELAAALQSSQAAANRRAMENAEIRARAEQRGLAGIAQAGALGTQMRGQEFGEQAQEATAQDRIAQFNVAQQSEIERRNLEREQAIRNQAVQTATQQEIYNKGLIQQDYLNRMAKEQAIAAAKTGTAQQLTGQAGQVLAAGQAAAQGQLQTGAAQTQLLGSLAGAGATAYGASLEDGGVVHAAQGAIIDDCGQYADGGVTGDYNGGYDMSDEKDQDKRKQALGYKAGGTVLPPSSAPLMAPNSNAGYQDGGLPDDEWNVEDVMELVQEGLIQEWKGTQITPENIPMLLHDDEFDEALDQIEMQYRQELLAKPETQQILAQMGITPEQLQEGLSPEQMQQLEAIVEQMEQQAEAQGGVPPQGLPQQGLPPQAAPQQQFKAGGAVMPPLGAPHTAPNSNGGFAGGGLPVPDSGMSEENRYLQGDVVPGNNFEGDRVDAKVNSGEMVLNLEQQQRLMELLKGLRSVQGLGDEDIISEEGNSDSRLPSPDAGFANGGMVPSEYMTPTEAKPRGVHASLKHEQEAEEKAGNESKHRKARMKAYETLINGGK